MKTIQSIVLKSTWFEDVTKGWDAKTDDVYQPGGRVLLPTISTAAPDANTEAAMKLIIKRLGNAGSTLMSEWLENSGLSANSEAKKIMKKILKAKKEKEAAKKEEVGPKKEQRTSDSKGTSGKKRQKTETQEGTDTPTKGGKCASKGARGGKKAKNM